MKKIFVLFFAVSLFGALGFAEGMGGSTNTSQHMQQMQQGMQHQMQGMENMQQHMRTMSSMQDTMMKMNQDMDKMSGQVKMMMKDKNIMADPEKRQTLESMESRINKMRDENSGMKKELDTMRGTR